MRLSTLAAVARRRASAMGYDATRWHRVACAAREAIRKAIREKRRMDKRHAVEIPVDAQFATEDCTYDEDDTANQGDS